jgi:hypothetical protein
MTVPQMRTEAPTRRMSLRTPQRVRTRPEVLPIWEGRVLIIVKGKGWYWR